MDRIDAFICDAVGTPIGGYGGAITLALALAPALERV